MSPDPLPFQFPIDEPAASRPVGPVDVGAVLEHLAGALDHEGLTEITIIGKLTGWRRTRAWGSAELVTPGSNGDFTARLPLGIPGRAAAAIEARVAATHPGGLAADPTVVVTGGLDVHPRYGPLRFVARSLQIDSDQTSRAAAERDAAVAALAQRGLFDRQRGLVLPDRISAIGVLAGGSTAALADFRERLGRHGHHFDLHEIEVSTGGPGAARGIAAALARLDRRGLDCLVVIRGGGPAIDLTTFDRPELVAAIGQAATPILTGIGHATDSTLADRAAHRALATPSAVADHIAGRGAAREIVVLGIAQREAEAQLQAAARQLEAHRVAAETADARLHSTRVVLAVLAVLVGVLVIVLVSGAL